MNIICLILNFHNRHHTNVGDLCDIDIGPTVSCSIEIQDTIHLLTCEKKSSVQGEKNIDCCVLTEKRMFLSFEWGRNCGMRTNSLQEEISVISMSEPTNTTCQIRFTFASSANVFLKGTGFIFFSELFL